MIQDLMYPTDPALDYVEEPTHDVQRPPNAPDYQKIQVLHTDKSN